MRFLLYLLLFTIITVPAFSQPVSQFEQLEGIANYIQGYHNSDSFKGSDSTWNYDKRRFQKFNSMMRITEFMEMEWKEGVLSNDNKTFYEYENDTLLMGTYSLNWRDGEWNENGKSEFLYDDAKRQISNINYQKRNGEWRESRTVNTEYDENGRTSVVTTFQNNQISIDTTKVIFEYDKYGNNNSQTTLKYRAGSWDTIASVVTDFYFTTPIKIAEYFWYAKERFNDKYDTLIYNNDDKLVEKITMDWRDDVFEKSKRAEYNYNIDGRNDTITNYQWYGKWAVSSEGRTVLEYNSNGIINRKFTQRYYNEQWVDNMNTVYSFNADNKIDSVVALFNIMDKWTFNTKVVYDFVTVGVQDNYYQMNKTMNYPNPFAQKTTIKFALKNPGNIHLKVVAMDGNTTEDIYLGYYAEGSHELSFDFSNLPAGNYLYMVSGNKEQITNIFTILK